MKYFPHLLINRSKGRGSGCTTAPLSGIHCLLGPCTLSNDASVIIAGVSQNHCSPTIAFIKISILILPLERNVQNWPNLSMRKLLHFHSEFQMTKKKSADHGPVFWHSMICCLAITRPWTIRTKLCWNSISIELSAHSIGGATMCKKSTNKDLLSPRICYLDWKALQRRWLRVGQRFCTRIIYTKCIIERYTQDLSSSFCCQEQTDWSVF